MVGTKAGVGGKDVLDLRLPCTAAESPGAVGALTGTDWVSTAPGALGAVHA